MPRAAQQPRVVMNISLGGAPGPNDGRHADDRRTADSGRAAVDRSADREEHAAALAPTPPKMALPDPKQKPRTPPKPTAASKDPKGTAVGRGFETQARHGKGRDGREGPGLRPVERRRRRRRRRQTRTSTNFCCPEYIVDMREPHHQELESESAGGGHRVHEIHDPAERADHRYRSRRRPSGNPVLDLAAQRALINTRTLAPLPAAFPEQQLPVHLEFRVRSR